jgi:hypothetical protein
MASAWGVGNRSVGRIDDDAETGGGLVAAAVRLQVPVGRIAHLPDALQIRFAIGKPRRLVTRRRRLRRESGHEGQRQQRGQPGQ